MRPTVLAATCLVLAFGSPSAQSQTTPGSAPSTGPASGSSGTTRSTGTSPDARARPTQRGLPSSLGLPGDAGGRPREMDQFAPPNIRQQRQFRGNPSDRRLLGRDDTGPGRAVDRYPASRLLPSRPGSPEESDRNRVRPPGLPEGASRSASDRESLRRRSGADYSVRECEQIYDSGTGMTRQAWAASCRRVGERNDRMR